MKTARIYKPAKTAMQSGRARTNHWVLEFLPTVPKKREPFMGYTSTAETLSQVRMRFDTREEAIDYAKRNDIPFRVQEPKEFQRKVVSYSDNFRYDRRVPWTH